MPIPQFALTLLDMPSSAVGLVHPFSLSVSRYLLIAFSDLSHNGHPSVLDPIVADNHGRYT